MITHTLDVLAWIWIIGGILLLPFNSLVCAFLICTKFQLNFDFWMGIVKRIWVLQIVWNLVFFSFSLLFGGAAKTEKGPITYTLTQQATTLGDNEWQFHFYQGGKEIKDGSEEATPFQKAYYDTSINFKEDGYTGLNPKGLPHIVYPDGSKTGDSNIDKHIAFDNLSEEEARTYIDACNTVSGTNPLEGIFFTLVASAVCPFLYTFAEAFILAAVLIVIQNPLLGAAIFGPTLFRLWRVGAFKV
jgi:hypothetical protein